MTWEFITKPVQSANAVSWEWQWRSIDQHGATTTSERTFTSFKACVADARIHGFTGDPEPGDAGTVFQRPQFRFTWY
jgi:hypothetical protein